MKLNSPETNHKMFTDSITNFIGCSLKEAELCENKSILNLISLAIKSESFHKTINTNMTLFDYIECIKELNN